jgi:hypothetical protein
MNTNSGPPSSNTFNRVFIHTGLRTNVSLLLLLEHDYHIMKLGIHIDPILKISLTSINQLSSFI